MENPKVVLISISCNLHNSEHTHKKQFTTTMTVYVNIISDHPVLKIEIKINREIMKVVCCANLIFIPRWLRPRVKCIEMRFIESQVLHIAPAHSVRLIRMFERITISSNSITNSIYTGCENSKRKIFLYINTLKQL